MNAPFICKKRAKRKKSKKVRIFFFNPYFCGFFVKKSQTGVQQEGNRRARMHASVQKRTPEYRFKTSAGHPS